MALLRPFRSSRNNLSGRLESVWDMQHSSLQDRLWDHRGHRPLLSVGLLAGERTHRTNLPRVTSASSRAEVAVRAAAPTSDTSRSTFLLERTSRTYGSSARAAAAAAVSASTSPRSWRRSSNAVTGLIGASRMAPRRLLAPGLPRRPDKRLLDDTHALYRTSPMVTSPSIGFARPSAKGQEAGPANVAFGR